LAFYDSRLDGTYIYIYNHVPGPLKEEERKKRLRQDINFLHFFNVTPSPHQKKQNKTKRKTEKKKKKKKRKRENVSLI